MTYSLEVQGNTLGKCTQNKCHKHITQTSCIKQLFPTHKASQKLQPSCQQEEQHLALIAWAWAWQQVCSMASWSHILTSLPTFSCPFLFFLLAPHPLLPESFPHFLSISPNPFQGKITFSLSNAILNIISLITHIVSSHYKSVFWLHLMNHCLL